MSRNTKGVNRRMRVRNQKKKQSGSKQRVMGGMMNLGFKGVPSVYLAGKKRQKFKGWQRENLKYRQYRNVS